MTVVAAAFVLKEIVLLLGRLRAASPKTAAATARLAAHVEALATQTISKVEAVDPVTARRLRKLGGTR